MKENLTCTQCEKLKMDLAQELSAQLEAAFKVAYEEAGMSGLCHEGRLECALAAINSKEIAKLIETILERSS